MNIGEPGQWYWDILIQKLDLDWNQTTVTYLVHMVWEPGVNVVHAFTVCFRPNIEYLQQLVSQKITTPLDLGF